MTVFFIQIPVIIIVLIVLAIVGPLVMYAAEITFWVFFAAFLMLWLFNIFATFIGSGDKHFLPKVTSIVTSIVGFFISLLAIEVFSAVGENGIKTLLNIFIGFAILQTVTTLLKTIKIDFLYVLFDIIILISSILLCMWSIGFDLSFLIKSNDNNIAYYECVSLEKESLIGKTFSSSEEALSYVPKRLNGDIYDTYAFDVTELTEEHIISTYGVGDILIPNPDKPIVQLKGGFLSTYPNEVWYQIVLKDGTLGYIPITGIKVYYHHDGEYVSKKQSEIIEDNWYKIIPKPILDLCIKYFEWTPHKFKLDFAE